MTVTQRYPVSSTLSQGSSTTVYHTFTSLMVYTKQAGFYHSADETGEKQGIK